MVILFVLFMVKFGSVECIDDWRDIIFLMNFFFFMFGKVSLGGFMFFIDGISCNFFMIDLYLSIFKDFFFFKICLFCLI